MILPIRLYGDPILRARTKEVASDSEELQELVDNMAETVRAASGIGLAAPQVGRSERLFIIDLSAVDDDWDRQPMVFINPVLLWESEEEEEFEEGCLSIPDLRELVFRPQRVCIAYLDRTFTRCEREMDNLLARVIQHEYDHLDGTLFIDHISPFRRSLLRRRLREIARGAVEAQYAVAPVLR